MKKNENKLTKTERFKAWNQAYTMGLLSPDEFTENLRAKMQSLMKDQPERYEVMLKAFDYALREKAREQQSKERIQKNTKESVNKIAKQERLRSLQKKRNQRNKMQDRGR